MLKYSEYVCGVVSPVCSSVVRQPPRWQHLLYSQEEFTLTMCIVQEGTMYNKEQNFQCTLRLQWIKGGIIIPPLVTVRAGDNSSGASSVTGRTGAVSTRRRSGQSAVSREQWAVSRCRCSEGYEKHKQLELEVWRYCWLQQPARYHSLYYLL